jgi:transposase
MDVRRERDVEQLRKIALMQQVQIEHLLKVLSAQSEQLDELRGKRGELQQALALLDKLNERTKATEPEASGGPEEPKKKRKKRKCYGNKAQPKLPAVEREYELDAADRVCPSCGGELSEMAGQYEESEMVDVIEVRYELVKVKQKKYRCDCGGCIETAPGPERAVAGGRYSLDFAIKVMLDKYLDHGPLTRQSRILRRHGLEVGSQVLWDQVQALARRLTSVYEGIFEYLMQQPVIGLDQTGWKRLEKKKPGHKPWQMWCVTAPGVVYHRIFDNKGTESFKALLDGYEGTVVCDALKTHEAGARDGPGIVLAGCWAHVFRKFEEAEPDHAEALMALDFIGKLYDLDDACGDDLEKRGEVRRTESSAVLADFKTWLSSQALLRSLSIGKAAMYTLGNWERLTRFVGDPRIPLDNNGTERGIRGPVVGRKNHYGSKSQRGTEVAAIAYTLIETAKLHDIDPAAYLRAAVIAADRGEVLLPWDFRPDN